MEGNGGEEVMNEFCDPQILDDDTIYFDQLQLCEQGDKGWDFLVLDDGVESNVETLCVLCCVMLEAADFT